MRDTDPPAPDACQSCRGRGWKLRGTRRLLSRALLNRGSAQRARITCPDCDGSGKKDSYSSQYTLSHSLCQLV